MLRQPTVNLHNHWNTCTTGSNKIYLEITAVVHLGTEGCEVAVRAKAGQPMTFDPYCGLREVEFVWVGQLNNVSAMKEGELDGKTTDQAKLEGKIENDSTSEIACMGH